MIGGNNNFSPGFDIAQFQNQSGGGGIDDKVPYEMIAPSIPCMTACACLSLHCNGVNLIDFLNTGSSVTKPHAFGAFNPHAELIFSYQRKMLEHSNCA